MSYCTRPIDAAISAVRTPTIATIVMTIGACENNTAFLPSMYTPAVTDPVRDERLLAGIGRALLFVPIADQQIRAETHALPAHEHDQEVVAQDEHEHEKAEQVQIAEEARDAAARLVGDVGRRVNVNQ